MVVIDSLNSYIASMPEEQALILHMHELLSYLGNKGVVTIIIMAQHGLIDRLHRHCLRRAKGRRRAARPL